MKKLAVIKYGGHAYENIESINVLIKNIKNLKRNNYNVVIVHGGTPDINKKLETLNIESQFVDGFRITSKEIMDIVQETLLGKETINIIKLLNKNDIHAVGLNGSDNYLLRCKKYKSNNGVNYGFVGDIINVNTHLITTLLDENYIPVISPLGTDDNGQSYNLNSDIVASKIALSLSADLFFMVTNVNGIYKDINKKSSRIKMLDITSINELISNNIINGSMLPKVNACIDYTKETNRTSYIINFDTIINYELLHTSKNGTKIVNNLNSKYYIRLANKEDVDKINKIVKTAFLDYQKNIEYRISPLSETNDDILLDIRNNYVFVGVLDGEIVSSIRLRFNKNMARLSRLCVNPKYYNKGFGSVIINYAEEYAMGKGASYVGLTTMGSAEYLKGFYKKNKYKKIISTFNRGYEESVMVKKLNTNNDFDINWYL